jgi:CHAT domain-containing protein
MRKPAIVHLASHFTLDPEGEDKSYLLLGDGRHLSLTELRQLPWEGVQLALLSACDSAVAVDAGSGRELVGFTTALRGAGVSNVVATLWRVSDGATAQWMEMFYARLAGHAKPALMPALRPDMLAGTQRQWLRRHAGSPLAHPHYWAAFSWIGPSW